MIVQNRFIWAAAMAQQMLADHEVFVNDRQLTHVDYTTGDNGCTHFTADYRVDGTAVSAYLKLDFMPEEEHRSEARKLLESPCEIILASVEVNKEKVYDYSNPLYSDRRR